jgi:hypothetical protein
VSGAFDPRPLLPALSRLGAHYLAEVPLPEVVTVRQAVEQDRLEDPEAEARRAAAGVARASGRPPARVAVGVGSRGIANLPGIVRGAVQGLRDAGWSPFLVPAMGSHGAATAAGQVEVLAAMGVTEKTVGAPVRATMETRVVGEVDGQPYPVDAIAVEAGAVFLVARVKPHTSFRGRIESGPAKMCAVGLGKQPGAQLIHNRGSAGLARRVPAAPRVLEAAGLLLGSVAIVENQRDETARIEGLPAAAVGGEPEAELLEEARRLLPRLPFPEIDVLVVDRMGKDISGAGMDTNVINRYRIVGQEETGEPAITAITVLDLTEASHGNAAGIGLADFIPARLLAKIDVEALYTNSITAGQIALERVQLPMVLATDRDAVAAAVQMCGVPPAAVRLVRIRDTLHTEVMAVSAALLEQASGLEVVGPRTPLAFDAEGRLRPLLAD